MVRSLLQHSEVTPWSPFLLLVKFLWRQVVFDVKNMLMLALFLIDNVRGDFNIEFLSPLEQSSQWGAPSPPSLGHLLDSQENLPIWLPSRTPSDRSPGM